MTAVRVTVLTPRLADRHETTGTPGCLAAPDGVTCCPAPATHRLDLHPDSYGRRATFTCHAHRALLPAHTIATTRELRP